MRMTGPICAPAYMPVRWCPNVYVDVRRKKNVMQMCDMVLYIQLVCVHKMPVYDDILSCI